jgi:hypothetical protein
MSGSESSDRIEAHVGGSVSGQVAVGNHIRQTSVHGDVVYVLPSEQRPRPRRTPGPVRLLPRADRALLDREPEVETASAALTSAQPIQFMGADGVGKSTLLRALARRAETVSFPDGILYIDLPHSRLPLEDLLQFIFEQFYEFAGDIVYKPTPAEIRRSLHELNALILIADLDLPRKDASALLSAAPGSAFALASQERVLWGDARVVMLEGLPSTYALALIEEELRRPLLPAEQPAAEKIGSVLAGHPLQIIQAVAPAREDGRLLTDIAERLATAAAGETVSEDAVAALPRSRRSILAALAIVLKSALLAQQLAKLTGTPDIQGVLDSLVERGILQTDGSRYRLSENIALYVRRQWDLTAWGGEVIEHFSTWEGEATGHPERIAAEAPTLLATLRWGAENERWTEVLKLVRRSESGLMLGRRWASWSEAVATALAAARAAGDGAAEAWALHQLGTHALCLADAAAAETALQEALRIRQSLGDEAGAKTTQHNLDVLRGVPPAEESRHRRADEPGPTGTSAIPFAKVAAGGVVIAAGALLWLFGGFGAPDDPEPLTDLFGSEPTQLHFADQPVGTASPARLLTLHNRVTTPLRIGDVIPMPASSGFSLLSSGCSGRDLSPRDSCPLQVAFTPTERGETAASLIILDEAGNRIGSVPVSGTGIERPVVPPEHVAILGFSANPDLSAIGEPVQLCYQVRNARRVGIEPEVGSVPSVERGCVSVSPSSSQDYVLTAEGEAGEPQRARITVTRVQRPAILGFRPERGEVPAGDTVRLCYGFANAASARIEPGVGEVQLAAGECVPVQPTRTTTYTLTVVGFAGHEESHQAEVEVFPRARIVDFRPDDGLCYALANAASARIEPDVGELRDLERSCVPVSPTAPTKYRLTVRGGGGDEVSQEVTYAQVVPPLQPPQLLQPGSPNPRQPAASCGNTVATWRPAAGTPEGTTYTLTLEVLRPPVSPDARVQVPREREQIPVRPPQAPQLQSPPLVQQRARWEVAAQQRTGTEEARLPELTPNSTYRWSVQARDRTGRVSEASPPLHLRCERIIH